MKIMTNFPHVQLVDLMLMELPVFGCVLKPTYYSGLIVHHYQAPIHLPNMEVDYKRLLTRH